MENERPVDISVFRSSWKSFWLGAGRVLDMGSTLYEREKVIPRKSVNDAIRGDWERIGQDMWRAIGKVDSEKKK